MTGKAFGEASPTSGEASVSWTTWSDGASGSVKVQGDADYGMLQLGYSKQARSAVYDTGSAIMRSFVLEVDRYGTGIDSSDVMLQIRGDTTSFTQDETLPPWENYIGCIDREWRYVQIRTVFATAYFVDATDGSDSADGLTPGTAWKTITQVNSVTFRPGDHVLFKRGETFTGPLLPENSGTADSPITFGAYGTGNRPIISGSASYALWIPNSYSYLSFYNIVFSGATGASVPTARANSHDLYFYDCQFNDSASYIGLVSYSTTGGSDIYNNTYINCVATGNYKSGFYCSSSTGADGPHDVLFYNCTSHTNGTDVYADHGFYVAFGCVIDHCTAYGNTSAGFKVNSNLQAGSSFAPIVRNSTSYNNADGLYIGHYNAIFYNNLVYSNTSHSVDFDSEADNCEFYFNTFVNSTHASNRALEINPTVSTGNTFKNNLFIQDSAAVSSNIIYTDDTIDTLSTNNTFDYNVYYWNGSSGGYIIYQASGGLSKTFADWVASSGSPESHGTLLLALPGFVTRYTDLHPADSGNLKGLGLYMSGVYATDKDGNPRSNPPTPGCYEEASA